MDIKVEVGPVTLDTVIGEHRIQYGEDGYATEPMTLGEAIADKVFADLKRDEQYNTLRQVVNRIREEEIRTQVRPLIEKALTDPIQKTNSYGHPVGEPTTLTEIIVAEAKAYLGKKDDSYRSDGKTFVQKLVAEAVDKTIRKELSEAIAEEKAKVVAAVRAKASELIAQAVKEGIGR